MDWNRIWRGASYFGNAIWLNIKTSVEMAGETLRARILAARRQVRVRTKVVWKRKLLPAIRRDKKLALSTALAVGLLAGLTVLINYSINTTRLPSIPLHYWWWGLGAGVVLVLLLALRKVEWREARQAVSSATAGKVGTFDWWGLGLASVGFLLAHLLFKASFSGVYDAWWDSDNFWPMNAAILMVAILSTQKGKPAVMVRKALAFLIVAAVGASLIGSLPRLLPSFPQSSAGGAIISPGVMIGTSQLPAETVLPIIAQCESGGRQFEDDGVTPLKNREGSSAFGKYQFLESHREPAKALGFDLNTEEGQEGYARYRYAQSGTSDWEADARSRACWEPKLIALGHRPSSNEWFVEASPERPTNPFTMTRNVSWESVPLGVRYEVVVDNHPPVTFPRPDGEYADLPRGRQLRFRSLEDKPVTIKMWNQ